MSLDILCRSEGLTDGEDVRGQTCPDAGKARNQALLAPGFRRMWAGCSCLATPRASDLIPKVYASQLTMGATALQSP